MDSIGFQNSRSPAAAACGPSPRTLLSSAHLQQTESSPAVPTSSKTQLSSSPTPVSGGSAAATDSSKGSGKRYFTKELRCMMYGFGDDKVPYTETVELLEDMVVEYIKEMTWKAMDTGKPGKVTLEDIWYLIRRDPKKFSRVKDLLSMNEELRKARKAFDESKYANSMT